MLSVVLIVVVVFFLFLLLRFVVVEVVLSRFGEMVPRRHLPLFEIWVVWFLVVLVCL